MYILYIDESGYDRNPNNEYFVLAGVAVHERNIYPLTKLTDELVASWALVAEPRNLEIHGNAMYQGGGVWRKQRREEREKMMRAVLALLPGRPGICAFGVAVHKAAIATDPVQCAYEEICSRFDHFLSRDYHRSDAGNPERHHGMVLMDESPRKEQLQLLTRDMLDNDTRRGRIRNLPELPVFADSRAHRIIQLADLVAYSLWRKYEHQDGRFFDPITGVFDAEGGVVHGLVHYKSPAMDCYCPACMSRRHEQTGHRPLPLLSEQV